MKQTPFSKKIPSCTMPVRPFGGRARCYSRSYITAAIRELVISRYGDLPCYHFSIHFNSKDRFSGSFYVQLQFTDDLNLVHKIAFSGSFDGISARLTFDIDSRFDDSTY